MECVICAAPVPNQSRGTTCSYRCRALLREQRKTREWRTQREYPVEIISQAIGLYEAGCTVAEVDEALGAGYKAQRILQRYLPERRPAAKRNQSGSANHMWTERPSYHAAHSRLGPAKAHSCIDCGATAHDWSYRGDCGTELTDDEGRRYCTHERHYDPRCVRCHRRHDFRGRRPNGQWLSREETA